MQTCLRGNFHIIIDNISPESHSSCDMLTYLTYAEILSESFAPSVSDDDAEKMFGTERIFSLNCLRHLEVEGQAQCWRQRLSLSRDPWEWTRQSPPPPPAGVRVTPGGSSSQQLLRFALGDSLGHTCPTSPSAPRDLAHLILGWRCPCRGGPRELVLGSPRPPDT